MAHVKADRVQETTTGTGTGALTLAGAVSKFRAFSATLANGDTCVCLIEHNSSTQWELSLCTYASGANTLTRSTIHASSTGSIVNFSAGTKTVSLVPPSALMHVEDANGDYTTTRDFAVTRNLAVTGTLTQDGSATFNGNARFNSNLGINLNASASYLINAQVAADDSYAFRFIGTARGFYTYITATAVKLRGMSQSSASFQPMEISGSTITFNTSNSELPRWNFVSNGHFEPLSDNTLNVGSATFRAAVIYAGTGTINTSDEREKRDISLLSDSADLQSFFLAVARDVRVYRFIASYQAKGDGARHHVGFIAQRIIEIGRAHNVDAVAHGFVGFDHLVAKRPKVDDQGNPVMIHVGDRETAVLGPDGEPLVEPTFEQEIETYETEGVRYSVRTDELLAGCVGALVAAYDALA